MNNRRHKEILIYRLLDWLSASLAWVLFFRYRKKIEYLPYDFNSIFQDGNLLIGLIIVPLAWLILYTVFDNFQDIYRHSRLATLRQTFILSLVGVVGLFFTILLDDNTYQYTSFLNPILRLFCYHFLLTAGFRMLYLSWAKHQLMSGKIKYNTLLVGNHENALNLFDNFQNQENNFGHSFVGYISLENDNEDFLEGKLSKLGTVTNLTNVIEDENIEDVIIAIDTTDHRRINSIFNKLYTIRDSINVKIVPDMYDIMIGAVKMNHIYSAGLIEVDQELMPKYELFAKRAIDIIVSLIALIIGIPLYVFVAIKVRLSSPGPVFFMQERVGRLYKPFHIIKFRSMYIGSEKSGPQLANDTDHRITPWGKVMRKYRLDELPQFYNVLRGDMSLVGPRPERKYYIDKIMDTDPIYRKLLKVRPGITSWGQVKFGYASDVSEMVKRLKYDLIYLENMSILMDVKILIYTVGILIQGRGK
jgi:exopolysaccharide biosynthesis polyprenyl glycosylphosphotransferase